MALELSGRSERFMFPGIEPGAYATMKLEEEQFIGYATPIDTLIERFVQEGMKVVLGTNPKSGNIFILPKSSDDIENDSILPKHLLLDASMDERLKALILFGKGAIL